jgi:cyclopropane fatty-acyl-phospholipid synthase-like methyltransferase
MIQKDFFENKSKTYSKDSKRVRNVQTIANGMIDKISYTKDMHIMDFGSGTGLLSIEIAPYVGKITGIDMSKSMNEELKANKDLVNCDLEILELDLSKSDIDKKFDGIISSMTLHHVEDIVELFKKFHDMLDVGGTIALSDLYTEDGTFHSEDTGVFHFGFDEDFILECAKKAGFRQLEIHQVSVAKKPNKDFPIFLLTGIK